MGRFEGRTVIVTGASQGMGASHAHGFVQEGANVLVADILEPEGRQTVQALGERAMFVPLDIRSAEQWDAAIAAAEDAFGPVSILVNNAGVTWHDVTIVDSDPRDWQRVIDTNLTGTYLGMRAVVPSMRKAGGGSIVNVSSSVAMIGLPRIAPYVASKWALRGLTKCAAMEMAEDNIRVNSVHPGMTMTPMVADRVDDVVAFTSTLAIPRPGDPAEVTRLVLYVASEEASFSTGSEFVADGGAILGPARPWQQSSPTRPAAAH
jgi:3alpha(or 20beta)-hydroxysteroid dehydrogenase